MTDLPTELDFPVSGLLPKKETAVSSFLTKYPQYDGRGTVIAIFDSGVDPGAPGLQKTSDGKVKVIHRFDCSGCGDVDTKTIVQAYDSYITALSGKNLKIPSTWNNPTNCYRVGLKHAYDLYPERLEERMTSEYKEKKWDEHHRKAVAEANRQLAEFEAKHTSSNLSDADKLIKDDLETKLEILTNYEKKFHDAGPVYDCILFHDGEQWQCCVDTSDDGDLEKCPLLGEYSLTHDYTALTPEDNLNFSMNVHDNGDTLELVGLCSSHGTHVASIAAAYFPDNPEQCGVAPGAQIVSFTIGDGRLGSMETGTALVRAIIKLMEMSKTLKIHVINMSYGEHAHFSDGGRIGELMNEVVNKYGVVWVASAGNHGPALSTIGTPPDISQETIIGVGAYVSPEMMVAAYSMRQKLPGMPFTWSSRGPCIDGGVGVTICAPGGAVTSVPNCTLRYSQLMNGTSMASPHVAGAVSLLVSGLIQQNLFYSPYSIKRAIENTASVLQGVEVFAQGSGLLQVDKCFEWLVKHYMTQEQNVRFHVSCGSSNSKGIYIRSKPTKSPCSYNISVEPNFLDSDNVGSDIKIKFNMKLALVCNASYVSCPTHLDVSNASRVFAIKIDPTELPMGVHSTFIEAFDVSCVSKGPVFKIPITVIQPIEVKPPKHTVSYNSVLFKPNTIKRHFFVVPHFATWAVLRMASTDENGVGRFVVHSMHLLPKQSCKTLESNKAVTVTANVDSVISFQVRSNVVLEVVIAKYWANLGELNLDYSISFYGIKPNQQSITMHAADGIHSVEVTSLQGEEILPSITLKNSVQILKPAEGKVSPLTARDVIPPNRQIYELLLVYNFTLTKATEVSPNIALLSDVLYESEFESQLWLLFDSSKQLLGCGDAYPSKYSIKLEKGDYVIRLHVRHEKKEYLDKLTEIPLLLQQKLSNAITLDVYSSYSQAAIAGKKSNVSHGLHSTVIPFYIAPLPADKFIAKSNNPAQFLTGYITYCKDDLGKKVDSHPFKYILFDASPSKKTSNGGTGFEKSDKNKLEECREQVRDLKTQFLSKLDPLNAEKFYDEFLTKYPDHLPLHTAYLQAVDPIDTRRPYPNLLVNIQATMINKDVQLKYIAICDKVIENISEEGILAFSAMKADLRSDASKIKTSMDQKRTIYLECLCRKGIILCRLYKLEEKEDYLERIAGIWKSLVRFVDPNDAKVVTPYLVFFMMWHAHVHKQYGRVLKYTMRMQEEKPCKELEDRIIDLCRMNGWEYLADHLQRNILSKFPQSYRPF
ncbi:tripeptidyl-peptidase 2 isoform X2 [Tribolium madens]|uniref:tripeptidyl-peptidase 2 isoform X2 n=1 Tax=Tribolium madens TaxID=41895 RepID=UPI001CF72F66|nr:tripeptidyl-peptidase 2 isoform X2 [Tribolium madens]